MKISRSYIVMIVLSLSFLSGGCSQDVSTSSQSQLVVEGWIDAGGFPVVKLTRTIPLSDDALSLDSLSRYMDRWAKVTISDGERTEILAGRYDKKYFPPFIYTLMICVARRAGSTACGLRLRMARCLKPEPAYLCRQR